VVTSVAHDELQDHDLHTRKELHPQDRMLGGILDLGISSAESMIHRQDDVHRRIRRLKKLSSRFEIGHAFSRMEDKQDNIVGSSMQNLRRPAEKTMGTHKDQNQDVMGAAWFVPDASSPINSSIPQAQDSLRHRCR
jgi:hypothetical protein